MGCSTRRLRQTGSPWHVLESCALPPMPVFPRSLCRSEARWKGWVGRAFGQGRTESSVHIVTDAYRGEGNDTSGSTARACRIRWYAMGFGYEDMSGAGQIVAAFSSATRLALLRHSLRRLGIEQDVHHAADEPAVAMVLRGMTGSTLVLIAHDFCGDGAAVGCRVRALLLPGARVGLYLVLEEGEDWRPTDRDERCLDGYLHEGNRSALSRLLTRHGVSSLPPPPE